MTTVEVSTDYNRCVDVLRKETVDLLKMVTYIGVGREVDGEDDEVALV